MDGISNLINFDVNENRPVLDNHKVNSNDILNVTGENKLSTVEPVAFFQSNPVTEKQVLESVNNFQNENPNSSFTTGEYSTDVISNNSEENITSLSSETEATNVDSVNSFSLVCETASSIETSNSISTSLSLSEMPEGNVNFLPDALSDEICGDNQKNLSNSGVQGNEMSMSKVENVSSVTMDAEKLKDEKNNSCMVVQNFDFSFREQENVTDDLLGSFTGIDSVPKHHETSPNSTLGKNSDVNPSVNMQENKPVNTSVELLETNCGIKVSEDPATHKPEDSVIRNTTENCAVVLGDSNNIDSSLRESENPEKKAVNNIASVDNASLQLEKPSKAAVEVVIDPVKLDVSADNECREANSDKTAFQVSNPSNDEPGEFSPLKVEKVLFDVSDKPIEQFSDPDFAFKLPENPSNTEPGEFSPLKVEKVSFDMSDGLLDPDFAFKVPEVPSNNPSEQFGDSDFAFKMPEKPLANESDEQFVDAVQFFRDPNSFQFLENIRTSTVQSGSAVPRSSLYVNFDPLHSKFQTNVPRLDNCELISSAVQESNASVENSEKCSPEVVNKHLVDVTARESLGNILMSFDSPKSSTRIDSLITTETLSPPKMFTEEELQKKLKIYELETQEAYLKKQREMEMQIAKRDNLLMSQRLVIEELCGISVKFSEDIRKNQEKVMSLEGENEKLKEDLKTSTEDLLSVENTFTDFYKRYEQCKGMLKTYKDNEEHLKQTILDLQAKAKEQAQMYNMLQERTEEMLEKANVEVDNVRRSGEAQVTVLKAQLKKAEMKISSLESDIKQIKMENSQLGGICDDLMAKVSRS